MRENICHCALPDEKRMMGSEVVEHSDEPFVCICSPICFLHIWDALLFGALRIFKTEWRILNRESDLPRPV